MGRATVRAAIADYLTLGMTTGQITFLSNVFANPAKVTAEGDFFEGEQPGTDSGAVIYVYLFDKSGMRESGGPSIGPTPAVKTKRYNVILLCPFRSTHKDTQSVGTDNDTFLDSLEAWIERDRTAGTAGPSGIPPGTGTGAVSQWGEGDGPETWDINVKSFLPRPIRAGVSQVWNTIEIITLEQVRT